MDATERALYVSPSEQAFKEQADDRKLQVAGGKLMLGLQHKSRTVSIESGSCYGTALLIPQLARSLNWPRDLTCMAIRSYVFLILCIILHTMLLVYIAKEEHVMDALGGQMYLCDFAAVDSANNDDMGIGPSKTHVTPDRVYSWDQYATRNFVVASLGSMFPDRGDDVNKLLDAGEYGLESYWCRLLCVFVFVLSVGPELRLCFDMAQFFQKIPTKNESWIELKDTEEKEDMNNILSHVTVKACGMSISWKVFGILTIMLPKILLVFATVRTGVTFLMETAGIDDIIVNSVALGFLLSLDELLVQALSTWEANELCDKCEAYEYKEEAQGWANEDNLISVLHSKDKGMLDSIIHNIPWKFVFTIVSTYCFVMDYYWSHCQQNEHGRWVSKEVFAPTSLKFSPLNAVFPSLFPLEEHETPYWEPNDV